MATSTIEVTFLTKWGFKGTDDGQFDKPSRIAVDEAGNVYVVDRDNHRVQVFSPTGKFLAKWGSEGAGDGQFSFPGGIAVDRAGNVYVVDDANHRVQVFSPTGEFLTKWGSRGTGDGQFDYPLGIAVDEAGNVYVADYGNHRVQVFSPTGEFLINWGSRGSGDGHFYGPDGIAVDGAGNVYVVDRNNYRVQVFGLTLKFSIAASAGAGGSITPSGPVPVEYGTNQTFNILPDTYFRIADVVVDGTSVEPVSPYTFVNVVESHTIEATFTAEVPYIANRRSKEIHKSDCYWVTQMAPSNKQPCGSLSELKDLMIYSGYNGCFYCLSRYDTDTLTSQQVLTNLEEDLRSYIANRRSKEIHKSDCYWVTQMAASNKQPCTSLSELRDLIFAGYNGCFYCLSRYDTDTLTYQQVLDNLEEDLGR